MRADYPIPPQAGIYYFEVEIVSKGQKGYIGIGFSSRAVDLERLPGMCSTRHVIFAVFTDALRLFRLEC